MHGKNGERVMTNPRHFGYIPVDCVVVVVVVVDESLLC